MAAPLPASWQARSLASGPASTSGRLAAAAPWCHPASRRRPAPAPPAVALGPSHTARSSLPAGGLLSPVSRASQQHGQQQGLAQPPGAAQLTAAAPPPAQPPAASTGGEQQVDEHELRRRQKISAANKGRVPWNKGRKHPPEVIARIRAATQKAMQRPEVKERLAKANERREPHTDEAKAKIRIKLLQRASAAREEINRQAEIILRERLAGADDPEWQALAEYPKALDVVAGLAWQYFKKDWSEVSTRGWDEHPEFRERCISKLHKLKHQQHVPAVPKRAKTDKVKAALANMRKLQEAVAKVDAAEEAVTKLRRAKVAFAGDAARLQAAIAAEEKAVQLLDKLRHQVSTLERALKPVQDAIQEAEAAPAQQHAEHEAASPALMASAAQHQLGGEAQAPASLRGPPAGLNGHATVHGGMAAGRGQTGLNGSRPLALAGPVAAAVPWQR